MSSIILMTGCYSKKTTLNFRVIKFPSSDSIYPHRIQHFLWLSDFSITYSYPRLLLVDFLCREIFIRIKWGNLRQEIDKNLYQITRKFFWFVKYLSLYVEINLGMVNSSLSDYTVIYLSSNRSITNTFVVSNYLCFSEIETRDSSSCNSKVIP